MNQVSANQRFKGAQPYRVSADNYLKLVDAGGFGDAHVELVEGELVEMSPSHSKHGKMVGKVYSSLAAVYSQLGCEIFIDTIVELSTLTLRAPDICVTDSPTDDQKNLPASAILLAVEISDTTLAEDIGRKRIDYASAGIRHYWVVDVEGRRVHCYADPQGADYAAIRVVPFGEGVEVPGAEGAIIVA